MSRQDDSTAEIKATLGPGGGTSAGGLETEQTMPLMAGVARPEGLPEADAFEPTGLRSGGRLLSSGTLVILAVAAVAAGSLYLMRSSQHPIATSDKAVEAKIEQALVKLSSSKPLDPNDPLSKRGMDALFGSTDRIVSMFTGDSATKQVPVEYLKKDPFVVSIEPSMVALANPGAPENARFSQELKDLKLEAVMEGRVPVAVISGTLVQPGQHLGNFTVKSISGLTVDLEAGGTTYTLKMDIKPEPRAGSFRQMK